MLDQSSLLPIAIADFPWWGARSIDVVGDTIILRFTDSIQAISIDSWRPRWHRDLSEELSKMPGYVLDCAFSSDLKGMLLSNSEVVSLNDGETQFHLPPLEKCGELITLGEIGRAHV